MERYQLSEQELAAFEELRTPFAVFQLVDRHVVTLALSDGFCELLGSPSRADAYAAMDHDTLTGVHPDDAARVGNTVSRFMREGGTFESIYRLKDKAGYRVVHAMGKHVFTKTGARLANIWYMDEGAYSETGKNADLNQTLTNALHEESILKANYFDELTGLPNLSYFFDLAEMEYMTLHRRGEAPVLLYMDLNGMKYYNHKHGFAEGDKLLQAFSRVLARLFGIENCGHVGADRFVVYTKESGLEDALRQLFQETSELNGGRTLPVRVGVYPARIEEVSVSVAYDRAKIACDALKKADYSSFNYYNQELSDYVQRSQYILENLDRAISEQWIQVYYQPIVRGVNGKACDVEALARWIDPAEGFLAPEEFIPFLEDAGVIYKLDLYVLEQVLKKMNRVTGDGLVVVPHSINLSRSDFDACDIVEEIRKRVDAAGIRREKISIEITESVIGSDYDFMKAQVERFQKLGFHVWMDDFGSGYSALDVLQSIKFDLLKFDMGFMRKLNEGEDGKIILTELMKMATSLGVDTICEGVETEEQVRFLQEIGCSKLQGYYFSKPVSYEQILERRVAGHSLLPENPDESAYYDSIGRVNLFDLAVISNEADPSLQKYANMTPMGIIEIRDHQSRVVRSNQPYRDFIKRFFDVDVSPAGGQFNDFIHAPGSSFIKQVKACCRNNGRVFFDEQMPDGTTIHSFIRKIASNPITGTDAVAIAVLTISEPNGGASYAEIARALAADYYNIYIVDLDTDQYIAYNSPAGSQEMAMERHGGDFFEGCKRAMSRIYEEDKATMLAAFSKEKVIQAIDRQGVFTAIYRLIDTGVPVYMNMKITRMRGGNRIIMGISSIDAQMKQKEKFEEMQKERATLVRVMALSEGYLCLITVDPQTGRYVLYSSSEDFESLGATKEGEDLFRQSIIDSDLYCFPEDKKRFQEHFTKENVLREIRQHGRFTINYRLVIKDVPRPVTLKAALFKDGDEEKMVVGLRERAEKK